MRHSVRPEARAAVLLSQRLVRGTGRQLGTSVQAGDISGQLVVGNNNDVNVVNHIVVLDHGSSVAPSAKGPPRVRRRPRPADWVRPPRAPVLLGRDEERARIDNRLSEGYAVRVHGPPGSGRTALLSRVAADRGPDAAVVFVHAAGMDAEDVLQQIFQSCYDTEDYKPGSARLRRLMAPVEALVVVDDFEDPDPGGLAALRDALPGCDVLVSSTEHGPAETGAGTRVCRLGGLSASASLALLERELDRPLSDAEAREAACFAAEVHGHPRALVASAALLEAGGSTAAAAFTADEAAVASGLAGRLGQGTARLLGALCAFQPLPVSAALLGAVGAGTPVPGALTELQRLRLVTRESSGYRAGGRLAVLTAERAGTLRVAADATAELADWIGHWPGRREVAAGSGLVRRALAEAARQGDDTAVRDLARAAAPVLARSLCWGAWTEVLALGGAAAARLGATEDVTYFAREENVRRKALGLASVAAGLASAAGGMAAGQAISGTDPPTAEGMQEGGAGLSGGSSAGLSGPLAAGLGVLVLGVGGLVAGLLASGGGSAPAARPAATPYSTPGFTTTPGRPGTFEPSRPGAGGSSEKPSERATGQGEGSRPPGSDQPDEPSRPSSPQSVSRQPPSCRLEGQSAKPFQAMPVGSEDSRTLTYTGYDCDSDESVTFSVTPETQPPSFTLKHQGCSPTGDRQFLCTMIVTFRPQTPGSYTARLDVAHDGDTIGMTIPAEAFTEESPSETTVDSSG
ncbi:hypothetical protein ACFYRC_35060 [Streptomyces sp. NPDC005279]|uniref:hypothetical protein n=1 Tax=Streptomyces sp. NPDC005279 TaxID=3364712 RepID=UPI0036B93943